MDFNFIKESLTEGQVELSNISGPQGLTGLWQPLLTWKLPPIPDALKMVTSLVSNMYNRQNWEDADFLILPDMFWRKPIYSNDQRKIWERIQNLCQTFHNISLMSWGSDVFQEN